MPRSITPKLGFSLLLGLLCLVAAGKVILADTLDPDCFWHLRIGAEISGQSWPGPLIDDLSFASIRQPWTPYSWLAEIGMKRLWDLGGFRAAVFVQALMESTFILLLGLAGLELSRRVHGQPRYFASALGAAMGGLLSLAYLSFRPVTAALTILAFIAFLLLRDRRLNQRSKSVWLVPALTAMLINIHFFALFVPLWIAALSIGDLLETRATSRSRRNAILFLACLAACCATPLLPGTIHSIVHYSTTDPMVRSGAIAEFRPFYLGTLGHVSLMLIALLIACVIYQLRSARYLSPSPCPPLVSAGRGEGSSRIGMGEVLWLTISTILIFLMGRMSPVFAIIAAPVFAAVIPRLSDRILSRPPIVAGLTVALAIFAFSILRAFPSSDQPLAAWLNRNGPEAPNYPCQAADFVEAHVPTRTHHLLCDLTWGGFLEWRLAGQFQTLMDGRTQLFTPDFWQQAALGTIDQRRQFLSTIPADVAVVRTGHSALGEILTAMNWKTVYRDQFAEVLVPQPKPEIRTPNAEAISKSE